MSVIFLILFFTALIFDLPDQILKLLKARERLIFWTIYDLIYSYSIISTTDNNNNILFFNVTKKKLLFYHYYYHWVMGFYATCISGFYQNYTFNIEEEEWLHHFTHKCTYFLYIKTLVFVQRDIVYFTRWNSHFPLT